jgi:hypothetical protein
VGALRMALQFVFGIIAVAGYCLLIIPMMLPYLVWAIFSYLILALDRIVLFMINSNKEVVDDFTRAVTLCTKGSTEDVEDISDLFSYEKYPNKPVYKDLSFYRWCCGIIQVTLVSWFLITILTSGLWFV